MHRISTLSIPSAIRLALAGLVAVSTLGLVACDGRDDAGTRPATTADGTAATQPGALQPGPATPPPAATTPAATTTALTEADRGFLAEALASNQHELQAAQLGLEKAQDEQVRAYAQRMQQDHGQLGNRMQPLVQQAGISMAQSRVEMTGLETATGEAFDRAFMEMMLADHRKAVAAFERAANDPAHGDQVRGAATEALPVLQSHLQEAEALAGQLGVGMPAPTEAGTTPPPAEGEAGTEAGDGGG